ncbi:MAG: hypothetical protein ABIT20_25095 [Gemmatimonadaceae bacterium]
MPVLCARLSMALLIAAPFAAAPLSAQSVEYAAGTTRYRISTTTKGSQSSPMGSGDFEIGLRQQVTVNLMKHAKDTVMATITIDSIALKTVGPSPDVSSLVGKPMVALISPTGKFYSTEPAAGTVDPALAQITEGVSHILPSYRANLASGMTWADTVSGKVNQQGMDLDRTSVTTYKVSGDTTIGGQKAMRVERSSNVKATGSGTMQNTPVTMETVGNSTGAFFLTSKGVYLGGTNTDDVNLKITILAQNTEITIKQVAQTTTEAIK